jgi:XRE family transcriptional regulator, regulator of sulfur utilization
MQRVHRNLSREDIEALRQKLAALIPQEQAEIPELVKLMRLITRKSQAEYARFCGVAPRVLADLEAGKGSPRVETLEKLLRPFGCRAGVVAGPPERRKKSPT